LTSAPHPVRRGLGCRTTGSVFRRRRNRTLSCVAIGNPAEAGMAGFVFLLLSTAPRLYPRPQPTHKDEGAVILAPRKGRRRRSHHEVTPERRNGKRPPRTVMTELQKYGWVLVHR